MKKFLIGLMLMPVALCAGKDKVEVELGLGKQGLLYKGLCDITDDEEDKDGRGIVRWSYMFEGQKEFKEENATVKKDEKGQITILENKSKHLMVEFPNAIEPKDIKPVQLGGTVSMAGETDVFEFCLVVDDYFIKSDLIVCKNTQVRKDNIHCSAPYHTMSIALRLIRDKGNEQHEEKHS